MLIFLMIINLKFKKFYQIYIIKIIYNTINKLKKYILKVSIFYLIDIKFKKNNKIN